MQREAIVEHIPRLRRYARALTGDAWAADDLVQDTLERACGKWRLWVVGSNLRAWLFALMHNLFANQARNAMRQMRSGQQVDLDDVGQQLAVPSTAPDVALSEPAPAPLVAVARQAQSARQRIDHCWRWGGMAAGVLLAFGLGWASHGQFNPEPASPSARVPATAGFAAAREFAHQATLAHAVYVPEVRHPVEVAAAQQEHLVQWLSKRLNRPLKVPNLSAQGYELVGGRLLPGDAGARAQFMFQNAAGERITLYLGALKNLAANIPPPATTPDRRETAFSFSTDGPVSGFYWVDQGFGYALAGSLSREKLLQIAQAVYQQL